MLSGLPGATISMLNHVEYLTEVELLSKCNFKPESTYSKSLIKLISNGKFNHLINILVDSVSLVVLNIYEEREGLVEVNLIWGCKSCDHR